MKEDKKKEQNKIISLLESMLSKYNQEVTIANGVKHSDEKLKKIINLYVNSKFENISTEEAREKGYVFHNILTQKLRTFERFVNLDRKHFWLRFKDKIIEYLSNIAQLEMMDDEDFGNKLNNIIKSIAKYGTAVLKIRPEATKGKRIDLIDFNRVIWDQNDYRQAPIIVSGYMKVSALKDKQYNSRELFEKISKKGFDIDDPTSRVQIYEIYGDLPESFLTYRTKDTDLVYQYHIVAQFDGKFYVIWSSRYKRNPFFVIRRNPVYNRSMGYGVVEEALEAQVQVNEVVNLQIKELRNIAKDVFQTTDEGLDGLDLSEIEDMTVIKTEKDTDIKRFPSKTSNFMAYQSYLIQWLNQSKEQSGDNNAALGFSDGSREPVGTRHSKDLANAGIFSYETEQIALQLEQAWKKHGILEIVYSYFNNKHNIETLLTREQLNSFYEYLAKVVSARMVDENYLNGVEMTQEEIYGKILESLKTGKAVIDFNDILVDKEEFIDKVRFCWRDVR